jgi:hypothetical protein
MAVIYTCICICIYVYIFYHSMTLCMLHQSLEEGSLMMAENVYRLNICNWCAVVVINKLMYDKWLFIIDLQYVVLSTV